MKIIEALKRNKDLQRKADDLRKKIADNCADMDADQPAYGTPEDQLQMVAGWLQAHSDILKEIEKLRLAIQRTNLAVEVAVEVADGKKVMKSIAAWIHRRKDLAGLEATAWRGLTIRGLQARNYKKQGCGEEFFVANVRKYFDPKKRDLMVEEFTSEPTRIDAALEIANAITDIVD